MEMMRWSARRKLLLVIPSSFNLFASKYTSAGRGQNNKIYPLSSPKLLSSSSAAATAGKMMLTKTPFSFPTQNLILFQTRHLHVNPPNQGWFDGLESHFKNMFMETVPFTKRARFVLFSLYLDESFNQIFKRYLLEYMLKGLTEALHPERKQVLKILPEIHPQSVRVKWIMQDILDALDKNMNMREDVKATTEHLEGLKWEIFVIDDPGVSAFCLPGGIIFVYSGVLQHFNSDGEIAAVIGHEVGHIVAGHHSERITNIICSPVIKLIGYFQFYLIPVVDISKIQQLLRYHAFYLQWHEMEADYIGLILMAWAGYDPRNASKVFEKTFQLRAGCSPTTNPVLKKLAKGYPSFEKRAHLLNQFMGQALNIHNQVEAAHWILPRRFGGLHLIKKV